MVHKKKSSAKTAKAVSAKSASVKKDARKVSNHRQATKPIAKSTSKSVAAKAAKPVTKPANGTEIRQAVPTPKAKVQAAPAGGVMKPAQPKVAAPVSSKAPVVAAKAVAAAARPAAAPRAIPAAVDKPDASRLTAPATPRHLAEKAAVARQQQINAAATAAAAAAASKKPLTQRNGFKTSEFIVYPAHGVGRIIGIEEQEIAGISLELFVIQFEKDKMTLRVPTGKSQSVGMRKLSDDGVVKRGMETLKGKARIKRTMWSRRAQEYEAKINSGDLIAIAEVVRDLYRSETQPEQSYSERQLYEAALDRMAREIAAVEKLDERGAMQRITDVLSKSAKGRRMAEETAGGGAEIKAA